jgi:hypothetical protein
MVLQMESGCSHFPILILKMSLFHLSWVTTIFCIFFWLYRYLVHDASIINNINTFLLIIKNAFLRTCLVVKISMIRAIHYTLVYVFKDTIYKPHAKWQYCAEYSISINKLIYITTPGWASLNYFIHLLIFLAVLEFELRVIHFWGGPLGFEPCH